MGFGEVGLEFTVHIHRSWWEKRRCIVTHAYMWQIVDALRAQHSMWKVEIEYQFFPSATLDRIAHILGLKLTTLHFIIKIEANLPKPISVFDGDRFDMQFDGSLLLRQKGKMYHCFVDEVSNLVKRWGTIFGPAFRCGWHMRYCNTSSYGDEIQYFYRPIAQKKLENKTKTELSASCALFSDALIDIILEYEESPFLEVCDLPVQKDLPECLLLQ
jgi:hypothetical protein